MSLLSLSTSHLFNTGRTDFNHRLPASSTGVSVSARLLLSLSSPSSSLSRSPLRLPRHHHHHRVTATWAPHPHLRDLAAGEPHCASPPLGTNRVTDLPPPPTAIPPNPPHTPRDLPPPPPPAMDLLRDRRLGALLVVVLVLVSGAAVEASIHTYDREPFREVGNAFLLSGGSEGVVADGADLAAPASSFIK